MQDEQNIIERVLEGETASFRVLVERYQGLVYQFARNMLQGIQDAEDTTQEVFVAAYRNLARFDATKSKLSTWLLTITRRQCCNQLKRQRIDLPGDIDAADPAPGPDQVAAERETWRLFSAALAQLPVEQRAAFVLAEIQQLPHAEIAAIEQIELGTVKSRVSRARDRLRQVLSAHKGDR